MKKFIILAVIALTLSSCTENQRARTFGGTATINVEKGKKVMMATWKDEDLFYMVEDMEPDYVPHNKETYRVFLFRCDRIQSSFQGKSLTLFN